MVLNWKGKIGYGDIASPICYAHNIACRFDIPVDLRFHWPHKQGVKINPLDAETLDERANYIFQRMVPQDVTLTHIFSSRLSSDMLFEYGVKRDSMVYEYKDQYHNFWYSTETCVTSNFDTLVIGGSHNNSESLKTFEKLPSEKIGRKGWKDPIGQENWKHVIEKLSTKYKIVEVDYRTPIAELYRVLSRARGFIGYHGSTAWIARLFQIPMIVFSSKVSVSQHAFFNAAIKTQCEETFLNNIETYFEHSRQKIRHTNEIFSTYEFPQNTKLFQFLRT